MSDDEIMSAVKREIRTNAQLRGNLEQAISTKNDSWLRSLLRGALSTLKNVGEFLLASLFQSFFS